MTTGNGHPPRLDGCAVLPPMEPTEPPAEQHPPSKRTRHHGTTGDRFRVLNAFVDATAGQLTRAELTVWLVLYRDTRDGIAQTSQANIARRAGISDRAVRHAIERLTRRGLVVVVYRGGLNRGQSKYRIKPTAEA